MIVIPVFNDLISNCEKLLNSINNCPNIEQEKVVLVNTQSTAYTPEQFQNRFESKYRFKLFIEYSNRTYDTGALLHCFEKYPNEEGYFLLHDSMYVRDFNVFNIFKQKSLETNSPVAWSLFGILWDNQEQIEYIKSNLGWAEINVGIFGSIMYIPKHVKENLVLNTKIMDIYLLNKNHSMAMERGWCILFKMLNYNLQCIEEFNNHNMYTTNWILFHKQRQERQ